MTRYFTHHWKNLTWFDLQPRLEGEPIGHTAGNRFRLSQVARGDFVYVVTVYEGTMLLGGRLQVDRVVSQKEAEKQLGGDLWEAADHVIALPGSGTVMRFDRAVPAEIAEELRFVAPRGTRSLTFESTGVLHRQTLRNVRELSPGSALLLDKLLD